MQGKKALLLELHPTAGGFILCLVSCPRQHCNYLKRVTLSIHLLLYWYITLNVKSDWNITNSHKENACQRAASRKGSCLLHPLLPCLPLALLPWQTSHPKKSWPCGLRFSKPDVQMNVQINNRKAFLKSFQVDLNFCRFISTLWVQGLWKSLCSGALVPRGLWMSRYFDTRTHRQP